MNLFQINQNGNRYCGPSAISAIAGIGTKEAAAIIRIRSNKTAIRGTSATDMRMALDLLGVEMVQHVSGINPRPTLRAWAASQARGKDVFLVSAGKHWIIVQGRWSICGKTKGLVPVKDHPNARSFVTHVHLLERLRKVDAAALVSVPKANENRREAACKRKTYVLAAQHGISIDQIGDGDVIWVDAPSFLPEDIDPYTGEHFCNYWAEALHRVQTYATLLSDSNQNGKTKTDEIVA